MRSSGSMIAVALVIAGTLLAAAVITTIAADAGLLK